MDTNNNVREDTVQAKEKHTSPMKSWNAQKEVIDELRKSANKYAVLDTIFDEASEKDMSRESLKTIDAYINNIFNLHLKSPPNGH